ncbi:alpha/beta hydrolase [Aurantimonas sp. Leaf443]|uniref:alpha/beta fold hydrolase n=1 Tax=Aurantimonas sp. Leaf443 TaxID=1736378 RepID=UPI0006F6D9B5|nr:alpha/beta hydrolase [Aurantimonas sp. Leaf443]KQT85798.1 hypothetical protein ASG48_04040 [Aurantimonas sp. Leaf443]
MDDQAERTRFYETQANPAPHGLFGGKLRLLDQVTLRHAFSASTLDHSRGTVLLLQGRNEAIEKYFETIADLNRMGWGVLTFDWRGQGGSSRLTRSARRGHVSSFTNYLNDLESIVQSVLLPDCRGPYVVMAHSMGALVALTAAPRLANIVERMVLAAPLVALPAAVIGPAPMHVGATLGRLFGLGALPVRREAPASRRMTARDNPLTHDARRFERNMALTQAAPQLFLGAPSVAWLAAVTGAMRRLEESDVVAAFRVPTLMVLAGGDEIVSNAAAERLAWRMRSARSLTLPAARHELLQEADRYREPFLEAFDRFCTGVAAAA